ncbi:MAG: Hg(II)-responsive transcriptional regulator [Gammaproteobacteria bacterium]|nr:Hg(II)-responsive transcriptional regulator [Gammaproteobacteria bacterium]
MNKLLTIGRLAKLVCVNVETIRYYQHRGLIEQPTKPEQGYRTYSQKTLERILFIKRAQELGFTLDEVANLLALGESPCQEVQEMAGQKIASVRAKIADLHRLEVVLDNLLTQCRSNPDQTHCPIVESLLPPAKKKP